MIKYLLTNLFIILLYSQMFGNPDSLKVWLADEEYTPIVDFKLSDKNTPLHPDTYHLGSFAAYKSNQFPQAILLAEKVLLSRPSHKQAKEIIKKSRQQLSVKQIQDVWGNRVQIIMSKLNPTILNLFAILISLMAIAGIVLYFRNQKKVYWILVIAACFWLLALVSLYISYQRHIDIKEGRYAIVMENSFIREGPDEISEKTTPLLSGTKIKKIDKSSDWFYIESEDGIKGWIPESDITLIRLP